MYTVKILYNGTEHTYQCATMAAVEALQDMAARLGLPCTFWQ
jgi:hypothetical protein